MIVHQEHNSKGNYNYNSHLYSYMNWYTHFHKNFELIYLLDGKVSLTVNGRTEQMNSGDCALILSNQIHSFTEQIPSSGWIAVFSEQFVPHFTRHIDHFEGQRSVFCCDEEIRALLLRYLIQKPENESSITMKKACFYAVCDQFLQKIPLVERKEEHEEFLCRVFDYIAEHYTENCSLASIAEQFGYEYHYLSRILNQKYHIQFSHLLNEFRVDHAVRLLENTDQSITEIAMASGFQSIRNFNHVFQSMLGVPPGQYSRQRPIEHPKESR